MHKYSIVHLQTRTRLTLLDFLDHLLRETPSKNMINFRRSYFARAADIRDRTMIGGGIEAMKGVYQSIRVAEVSCTRQPFYSNADKPLQGQKLVINVDVSNSCFWKQATIAHLAFEISGRSNQLDFLSDAWNVPSGQSEPPLWKYLRRLEKNKFYVNHRGLGKGKQLFQSPKIFLTASSQEIAHYREDLQEECGQLHVQRHRQRNRQAD